jgi:Gpi18-like mannosyltransferase
MVSEPVPAERADRGMVAPLIGIYAAMVILASGFRLLLLNQVENAGLFASVSMLVLFAGLFCLGMGLLVWKGNVRSATGIAVSALLLGLALFLRFFCFEYASGDYNSFLTHWVAFFRENGGFSALNVSIGDYNVPYLYFLSAISYLRIPDLYLIKLFSIFFEVLTAWGVFLLTRHLVAEKRSSGALSDLPGFAPTAPVVAFFITLFLPTAVLNGALWGQCDSIYTAFVLFAVYAALRHKGGASVVLVAVAFSFKLQAVFILPLFLIFLFTRHVKWYQLFLFPVTYGVICLPAVLMGRPVSDLFMIYLNQTSSYPSLSLNAPSLASFLPATADVALWSKICIAAAFLFVLILAIFAFARRASLSGRSLFLFGLLFAVGIPLLLPHMHERYFYLAEMMAVIWACARINRIFLPAMVQVASLSGYHAYLVLRYVYPLKYGALLFCLTIPILLHDLLQSFSAGNTLSPAKKEEETGSASSSHAAGVSFASDPDEPCIDLSIIAELADAPPDLDQSFEDLSSDLPSSLQMSPEHLHRHLQG